MHTVSTRHVDEPARFDFWATEIARIMPVSLDSRPNPVRSFHGDALTYDLGPIQLSSLSAGPMRVSHGRRRIAADETGFYKILLQISGSARIDHNSAQIELSPGDLTVCDTSRPYTFTYDADFQTALVLLPRPSIVIPVLSMRPLTGRVIGPGSVTGAAVTSLVRSLTEGRRDVSDLAATRLVDGTVSLITALLLEELSTDAPTMSSNAMLLRARDLIEKNLGDSNMTPDSIASNLGISRRYLFKLFAEEGTTVAGWIRKRRLDKCARDLTDPAMAGHLIASIGGRWGLDDPRHMARAFRAEFGCTPSEYRLRR